MDGNRFDQWSKVLGSMRSRRTVMALALALEAGGLMSLVGGAGAKPKKKCKPKCPECKKCVKGKCKKKSGGACGAGGTCENGKCVCTSACPACKRCQNGACVNAPNGTACPNDGDPCTKNACDGGICTHPPDNNACGDHQTCDSELGCLCESGFSNCNGNDADGCECETHPSAPDCCGSACHTVHDNGLGQTFRDCVALNTHDEPQAQKAADAWEDVGHSGTRHHYADSPICSDVVDGVVCHQTASACTCWVYSGTVKGRVGQANTSDCTAIPCPTTSSPQWT